MMASFHLKKRNPSRQAGSLANALALHSIALLGFLALGGCASSDLQHLKDPQTGKPFSSAFEGGKTTQLRALATPAVLVSVNSASMPDFDRVGFTFTGKNLPGYQVLTKAGNPKEGALFEMRFGARANWPNGKSSIALQNRRLNYPAVKSLSQTKVGEESVIWTASLSKPSDYRVIELTNPPRIVVDFKH